jgi:septal ring factor EnvC (AmiA/AmiB activator)
MDNVMNNINSYKNVCIKTRLVNRLLLLFILSLPLQNSFASNNLSSLQNEIKKSKTSQTEQNKKRQELEESVATLEQETAAAILQLQKTEKAITAEKTRLANLKGQIGSLQEEKLKQQKLLKQQLVSAYMTGKNDLIKLLLNQEDISQIMRAKSYYFYLNKARFESIEALQAAQQRIDENEQDQTGSLVALEKMHKQQKASKEKLLAQSTARSKALKELKQDQNYQKARFAQLSEAETNLKAKLKKQKIARQKRELAAQQKAQVEHISKKEDQIHSSISKQKGQLDWPIRGNVLASFGSQRSSQVKWKGISIAANEGEKVRAVATGRVLFAGYFKGYGMVIALDHSDDYITLYGYNQTLLQKTGDIVLQGDAIALAGHSGGQDKNSLYFEISRKGKAQDPVKWLKKRR